MPATPVKRTFPGASKTLHGFVFVLLVIGELGIWFLAGHTISVHWLWLFPVIVFGMLFGVEKYLRFRRINEMEKNG